MLLLILMTLLFGLGVGYGYTGTRAKYHRGCAVFFDHCAELIEQENFNPETVRIAFFRDMPWQPPWS